ncbi:MAG: DUF6677 family protein [Planctomycetota bacterium]|jgi:hypothetical protein
MSRRERLIKLAGGGGLVALGCILYAISQAVDPANRAAILAIIAIVIGLSWLGQSLRGHKEGPVHRDVVEAPYGPPISPERTAAGVLLAWAVPGLGHWIIGRRGKALLYFVVITATFLLGVLLAEGRNLDYERDKIYFLAYVFNLGETLLAWFLAQGLVRDHAIPYLQVGFLYTAVAGLLNLVAMMDFISTCIRSAEAPATGEERPA